MADCSKAEATRCDLVSLFHGETNHLHVYKKYRDTRLAFIVESQAANFGDPSTADWPYHVLNVGLLRVYEQGPADRSAKEFPFARL